jgi:hypothetical protein
MASTYVNDLRLNEMATGDGSGTWGTTTNTNLELIAEAFSYGTEVITTNADTHTTTIADGATDPGRSLYLKYTGTLDSACTITIGPDTVSKVWIIENGTSGSQNIIISCGSGANITIPAGDTKVVYSDGAGAGAAFVDAFASLSVVDLKVQDDLTVTDDASIGGDATITGTLGVTGNITGTLATAAQPNITSVGTLTALTGGTGDLNWDSGTLFVDSSANNVGIGTSSPTKLLEISDSTTGDAQYLNIHNVGGGSVNDETSIQFQHGGTRRSSRISSTLTSSTTTNLMFSTEAGGSVVERMRIDSGGNVLIGQDSGDAFNADAMLRLQKTGDRVFQSFKVDADQEAAIFFGDVDDDIECGISYEAANQSLSFNTGNNSEAMRIDSSGNVLVGKTATGLANAGIEFTASNILRATKASTATAEFNRTGTDGDIAIFWKDTSPVGSIGTEGGDMAIGNDDAGIQFVNGGEHFRPFNMTTNVATDGLMNIGSSSKRFNNLYLSGGVIAGNISGASGSTSIGGSDANYIVMQTNVASANPRLEPSIDNTIDFGRVALRYTDIYATNATINTSDRNEKQDIAELSDAEQSVAVACKGLLRKFRWKDRVADKGDDARIHFGIIAQDLQAAFEVQGLDAGDYAMFISSTWWETQTEVAAVEAVEEVTDEEGNVTTEAVEAKDAYTRTDTFETLEEAPEGATERTRLGVRYSELLAFIIAAI